MIKIMKTFVLFIILSMCFSIYTQVLFAEKDTPYMSGQLIVKVNRSIIESNEKDVSFISKKINATHKKYGLLSIEKVLQIIPPVKEVMQQFQERAHRMPYGRLEIHEETSSVISPEKIKWLAEEKDSHSTPDLEHIFILTFPDETDMEKLARVYRAHTDVVFAEPNYTVYCLMTPDDTYYADQWAIQKMNVPDAWDITTGSSGNIIAVLDSGVALNHPDIETRLWKNEGEKDNQIDDDKNGFVDDVYGFDFISDSRHIEDRYGHGTFVAGIIGAHALNTQGIAGVDWYGQIMPVKVVSDTGEGDIISVSRGLFYAVNNGADIINISIGTHISESKLLKELIQYASSLGCIITVAAGGDDEGNLYYPAGDAHVITVGASDKEDRIALFSHPREILDIAAPGVDILSLRSSVSHMKVLKEYDDFYMTASGTSASSAFASGVISLMLSVNPHLYQEEIKVLLQSTADELLIPDEKALFGRINAYKAVSAAQKKKEKDFYEYKYLLDTLMTGEWEDQKRAADSLVTIGGDIVQLLLNILEDPSINLSVGQKGLLIHTLGRLGSDKAVPYLMGALAGEENNYLRRNIVDALGKIGSPEAHDILIKSLSDVNAGVRTRAMKALGGIADESVGDTIRSRLSDTSEQVRFETVDTIIAIEDTESVDIFLDTISEHEVDQSFKDHLVNAIGELGDTTALGRLEDYRDELLKRDPEEKMLRFQWEQSVKTVEDAIEKIQNKSK